MGAIGWTSDTHMEMLVVSPPRADLGQPRTIRLGLTTHSLLDCRIDEDTGDDGILRSGADEGRPFMCPHVWINGEAIFGTIFNALLKLAFL